MSEIIVGTQAVADFFEVTARTIQHWGKAGCPKYGHGKWDLRRVFRWWYENIGQEDRVVEDSDTALQEAKRLYWKAKAEREQLQVEKEKGAVIPLADIEQEWVGRVVEVTSGLNALKNRLPPRLEGKDRIGMRDVIEEEVWLLRDSFARAGKYTPVESVDG